MTASWKDINKPSSPTTAVTAAQVANGPVIPPQQRLLTDVAPVFPTPSYSQ